MTKRTAVFQCKSEHKFKALKRGRGRGGAVSACLKAQGDRTKRDIHRLRDPEGDRKENKFWKC